VTRNASKGPTLLDLLTQIHAAVFADSRNRLTGEESPCAEIIVHYKKELAAVLPEFMRLQGELLYSLRADPNRLLELFPDLDDKELARVCRKVH
jgi:hypothetical protein